jgi:alkylation response protein AidB-like acyl-CoA dehydrogenase
VTDHRPVYTLTSQPTVLASYEEAMDVARSLGPRVRDRIPEAEKLRRLPDDTVTDLLQSGLCGVMKPGRLGGSELGAEALIDVSVELASHCASTGWVYMLWASHMWMQALWPAAAQQEMFENPNMLASSVVSTSGDVIPVDGGYRWTGRGFFSSGIDHCSWLTAAVPVRDEDTGEPGRTWLLIPREDFEIIDDWRAMGLRGTGSKTIVATDVFVPHQRTLDDADVKQGTSPGLQVNSNPMYGAISTANFTAAMAAPAIGAARGLLRAFGEKLQSKAGGGQPEVNGPYRVAGLDTTMARYAAAVARVDAVHALILQNAQRLSRVPAAKVSAEAQAKCRRDQAFAAQQSRKAANAIYEECGGSGLLESSQLQRIWRDANAAAAHRGLTWDWQADAWTRTAFGLPLLGNQAADHGLAGEVRGLQLEAERLRQLNAATERHR